MRSLWLIWLPLLYLPNLGFSGKTGFGELELSDILIFPFLVLLGLALRLVSLDRLPQGRLLVSGLTPLLLSFVIWTTLSTLLISERYGYSTFYQVKFGLLKLGKFCLYGTAGILISRTLADARLRNRFHWSLLAVGCVVAVSLITIGSGQGVGYSAEEKAAGYKATNAISVMMAMLICYLVGLLITDQGSPRWRKATWTSLAVMIPGFFLSDGRGGWIAAIGAGLYMLYRRGLSLRFWMGLAALASVCLVCYQTLPEFRKQVDITLWPDEEFLRQYNAGVAGVDDGARIETWLHELAKFPESPLLGTGFFHRGGESGLWTTGSHNFFLQMFLETGIVGGCLVLGVLAVMWRHAGTAGTRLFGFEIPLKSAVVTVLIGGLSGEYFYGGLVLMTLLLLYAPVGSLEIVEISSEGHGRITVGVESNP